MLYPYNIHNSHGKSCKSTYDTKELSILRMKKVSLCRQYNTYRV